MFPNRLLHRTGRGASATIAASLFLLAGCAELPTGADQMPTARPTSATVSPRHSTAPAGPGAVVYGFDDLAENCDLDTTFPSPYNGLTISGNRALALCYQEPDFGSQVLIPANTQTAGALITRFTLPSAATDVSIRVKGYNVNGPRSLVGYDAAGVEVDHAQLPTGEQAVAVLSVSGDIHAVEIVDYFDNSYWDDLTVVYAEEAPADLSAPEVSYQVGPTAPDGANGWYRGAVTLQWLIDEPESPESVAVTGCVDQAIHSDQAATVYTCVAESAGGESEQVSVTIGRDAMAPQVSFAGNAGSYTLDQTVQITCSVSDDTSGPDGGCEGLTAAAHTLDPGENTLTAIGRDLAGNTAEVTTTFTVTASYGSLCAMVQSMVTRESVARTLCLELKAIEHIVQRNPRLKPWLVRGLQHQISKLAPWYLTATDAATLSSWVGTL